MSAIALLVYPFDRTCLAYAVSEPGEWTSRSIWQDLGGYPAGKIDRVIHALARLRAGGYIEPPNGLRTMPDPPRVALFYDVDRAVFEAIKAQQPLNHKALAVAVGVPLKEVGRIVRKLARLGLVAPRGRVFPTAIGARLFGVG